MTEPAPDDYERRQLAAWDDDGGCPHQHERTDVMPDAPGRVAEANPCPVEAASMRPTPCQTDAQPRVNIDKVFIGSQSEPKPSPHATSPPLSRFGVNFTQTFAWGFTATVGSSMVALNLIFVAPGLARVNPSLLGTKFACLKGYVFWGDLTVASVVSLIFLLGMFVVWKCLSIDLLLEKGLQLDGTWKIKNARRMLWIACTLLIATDLALFYLGASHTSFSWMKQADIPSALILTGMYAGLILAFCFVDVFLWYLVKRARGAVALLLALVSLTLPSCLQKGPGGGAAVEADQADALLVICYDLTPSFLDRMQGRDAGDGQAFRLSLKLRDSFFQDKDEHSKDRIIISRISGTKKRVHLFEGEPRDFHETFPDPDALRRFLLKAPDDEGGSRVFENIEDNVAYVNSIFRTSAHLKAAICVLSDMDNTHSDKPDAKERLLKSLKEYAANGGVFCVYGCDPSYHREWDEALPKLGFKAGQYVVEPDFKVSVRLPR